MARRLHNRSTMLARCLQAILGSLLLLVSITFFVRPMIRNVPMDFAQFYFAGELVAKGQVSEIHNRDAYLSLSAALKAQGEKVSIAHYFNRPAFAAFFCYPLSWFSYRTTCNILVALNVLWMVLAVWKLPIWMN